MSATGNGPQRPAAPRPRREVWPVELRLLDRALAEGLLSEEWLTEVLRRGRYEGAPETPTVVRGDDPESVAHSTPEEVERWCDILLDRDRRTAAFDGLALSHGAGVAARYVLLEVDDAAPSRVTVVLAEGIADGKVAITGALSLLGELARDDEVMAVGLIEELFEELTDRGADLCGLEDRWGAGEELAPEDDDTSGEDL